MPALEPTSTIDRALDAARACIAPRVRPEDLEGALASGVLVVDIRPEENRRAEGQIPKALVVDRNVLEWRLDPTSAHRLGVMDDPHRPVILVCNEGYASSLAAAVLRDLGLTNVTDLDGGYRAWVALSLTRGAAGRGS